MSSDPAATKQAARKVGVHAHMPSSSQEWNVYPAMTSMAGRFLRTSPPKRWLPVRGVTILALARAAIQANPPPTTGPRASSQKASTYPPRGIARPVSMSARARPSEWPARYAPIARPRRSTGTFSATSRMPVV